MKALPSLKRRETEGGTQRHSDDKRCWTTHKYSST